MSEIYHVNPAQIRVCDGNEDNCQLPPWENNTMEQPICFKPVQMPYDPDGEMGAKVKPGDKARMFGWIYLRNNSNAHLDVEMKFRLYEGGLFINIETTLPNGEKVSIEKQLPLNSEVTVEMAEDGTISLDITPAPEGITSVTPAKETAKSGCRKLNMSSQIV